MLGCYGLGALKDKYGNHQMSKDDYLTVEEHDVVIIIRPVIKDAAWTGECEIIQSESDEIQYPKARAACSFNAMLMAMLPSMMDNSPEIRGQIMDYINMYHPDVLEGFMQRHVFEKE